MPKNIELSFTFRVFAPNSEVIPSTPDMSAIWQAIEQTWVMRTITHQSFAVTIDLWTDLWPPSVSIRELIAFSETNFLSEMKVKTFFFMFRGFRGIFDSCWYFCIGFIWKLLCSRIGARYGICDRIGSSWAILVWTVKWMLIDSVKNVLDEDFTQMFSIISKKQFYFESSSYWEKSHENLFWMRLLITRKVSFKELEKITPSESGAIKSLNNILNYTYTF